MTKQTKIVLGVVAGILVLCFVACVAVLLLVGPAFNLMSKSVTESTNSNPAEVKVAASEIADVTLPDDFTPQSSMGLLGFKVAVFQSNTRGAGIVLIELPVVKEINADTIRQLEQGAQSSSGQLRDVKTLEERDLTVRGKPAKMFLREGVDEDGVTMRQMIVPFQGKSGAALLMIIGHADNWDQAAYDKVVSTIR